jgi:hypothetical protein
VSYALITEPLEDPARRDLDRQLEGGQAAGPPGVGAGGLTAAQVALMGVMAGQAE